MAATFDGSIRINSKIDTSGVETGVSKITSGLKKFASMVGVAFSITAIIRWTKAAKEAWSEQTTAETKLATVMRQRTNATNGQIQSILDLTSAQQKLGVIGDEVQLAGAQQLATFTTTTGQLKDLIPAMNNLVAQQYGYNATTESAVNVANMMGRALEGQTGALTRVGISMSDAEKKTIQFGDKTQRAATLAKIITQNVGEMNQALASTPLGRQKQLENVMGDVNEQFGRAITQIEIVFIPVLQALANWLSYIASMSNLVAQAISDMFGTQASGYDKVTSSATSASDSVSGLAGATKGSTAATKANSKATKEASNNLANFDKINTLSKDTSESDGGAGSPPDLSSTLGVSPKKSADNSLADKIKSSLDGIYKLLIVSSALLVIGAILTFSGTNIPLGLALMIIGTIGIVAAAALEWGALGQTLKEQVSEMQAIFGGALLVIGAILVFSGAAVPLGIGLMIAGALNLVAAIAINWGSMSDSISDTLSTILGLVSGAFLVLGVMLCFLGVNIPLGIALIAIGAVSLAAAIAVDWNSTSNHIGSTISIISGILAGALLAIGAVMVFTGGSLPLGIGLMVVGAATLAAAVAINWNAVPAALASPIGTTAGLFAGLALLALGAILTFSGVALPLGIPLMVAGAATLAAEASLNWNSVKSVLQGPVGEIVALIGAAFLALGAVLAFSGVALPLGIALMAIGAASLATVTALNWETIQTALQGPIGEVVAAISIALLALGALLAFSGVALPLGIAIMALGAVSLATVVAVNWNTIVTALQGPIGAITAAASAALLALGVILCLSGVGIPLGIGLILAGAAGLAAVVAINWDYIPDKVAGIWAKIKDGTKNFINWMVGGIEWMVNKVLDGINWMIDQLNKVSFSVPDWVPSIGGNRFGFDISNISPVSLPRLAQGAVIPPNRQFMAVLGDQKSGTNIETPLDTMVDAFKTALSDTETQNNVPQTIQIVASGDDAGLIKFIKFSLDKENSRVGTKLVTGGGRY